jgi:hypothetical protein
MNEPPDRPPEPQAPWLPKLGKILLVLAAGTVALAVLAFGTCVLLLKHW